MKISTVLGVFALCTVIIFVMSCDKYDRHRVLNFLFDGVPPLEEEITDSNDKIAGSQKELKDSLSPFMVPAFAEEYKSVKSIGSQGLYFLDEASSAKKAHGRGRDCKLCHEAYEKGKYATPVVNKKIPDLCYGCHRSHTTKTNYLHGPVALGRCDFCHDAHGTTLKANLREDEPGLCYRCHTKVNIEIISGHTSEEYSTECSICHDPHSSMRRMLLKVKQGKQVNN